MAVMRMKRYAIILLAALFAAPAHAETLWLHAASKHWDGNDYNEFNPGLGIELPVSGNWSLEAGFYRNSHTRSTRYIWGGYSFHTGPMRVRPLVGMVDGYHETSLADGTALPVVAVSIEYDWMRMTVLPGALGFSGRILEW